MIRLMRQSDLGFADALRALAGWNQTTADWKRLLEYEPEGCFVAESDGRPAGTATTTRFGSDLAWIGMVLVHPEQRGRGIGTALLRHCLSHLDDRGVGCVKLDATPQGQPIYERLGFQPEWTLQRWEIISLPSVPAPGTSRCLVWDEYATVAPLDRAAFGTDRGRLLERLRRSSLAGFVHPDLAELAGFALIRPGARALYLGPVVARSALIADDLVRELLAGFADQPVYWDIPDHQPAIIELARRLGFVPQRPLIRMFRGRHNTVGQPQFIFGITGPETG